VDNRLVDDRRCFACGQQNEHGLRLHFEYGERSARATPAVARRFGGWSGMLHGGVVTTLLDEAMAHAAIAAGVRAVTARLQVRFHRPAPSAVPLVLEGVLQKRRGRMLELSATLRGVDGTAYAEGSGRFIAQDAAADRRPEAAPDG
jgi:acyl-coenzyme A thioesterase PaaI-like protein